MPKIHELSKITNDKNKKIIYSVFNREEIAKYFSYVFLNKVFVKKSKTESDNAFQFSHHRTYEAYKKYAKLAKSNKDKIRRSICKIFGIDYDDKDFENKFNWAVDGEGDELSKITNVNSSSLCALLCFYNISKDRPLYLDIDGVKTKFTNSIFEWENPVFNSPSSIDIVLIGHQVKKGGKKIIFFIESKFSEYYTLKKCNISKTYINKEKCPIGNRLYTKEIFEKKIGMPIDLNKKGKNFSIGDSKKYSDGIKQMISHYIGVINFLNGRKERNFGKYLGFIENADIYLGAIGYKIGSGEDVPYEHYRRLYNKLVRVLNDDLDEYKPSPKFKKVLKMISYQGIFDGVYHNDNIKVIPNIKIRTYYNLK